MSRGHGHAQNVQDCIQHFQQLSHDSNKIFHACNQQSRNLGVDRPTKPPPGDWPNMSVQKIRGYNRTNRDRRVRDVDRHSCGRKHGAFLSATERRPGAPDHDERCKPHKQPGNSRRLFIWLCMSVGEDLCEMSKLEWELFCSFLLLCFIGPFRMTAISSSHLSQHAVIESSALTLASSAMGGWWTWSCTRWF